MPENVNKTDKTGHEEEENSYLVPGRVTLSQLHKQEQDLKDAQEVTKGEAKGSKKMFDALSMYSVAIDFALMIGVPLALFVYLGRWADRRFNTKYLVLIGILLALATSSVAIYSHIKKLSNFIKKKK